MDIDKADDGSRLLIADTINKQLSDPNLTSQQRANNIHNTNFLYLSFLRTQKRERHSNAQQPPPQQIQPQQH